MSVETKVLEKWMKKFNRLGTSNATYVCAMTTVENYVKCRKLRFYMYTISLNLPIFYSVDHRHESISDTDNKKTTQISKEIRAVSSYKKRNNSVNRSTQSVGRSWNDEWRKLRMFVAAVAWTVELEWEFSGTVTTRPRLLTAVYELVTAQWRAGGELVTTLTALPLVRTSNSCLTTTRSRAPVANNHKRSCNVM